MRAEHRAFSLLELLIALVILGVIVGLGVARYGTITRAARINATVRDVQTFRQAVLLYRDTTGHWPGDEYPGVFPHELTGALDPRFFERAAPIGGDYDWNNGWGRFEYNLGIHDPAQPLDLWRAVDTAVDDGDLNTGDVQRQGKHLQFRIE